jgi:hypothetical protein
MKEGGSITFYLTQPGTLHILSLEGENELDSHYLYVLITIAVLDSGEESTNWTAICVPGHKVAASKPSESRLRNKR